MCDHKYRYFVFKTGKDVSDWWQQYCDECGRLLMSSEEPLWCSLVKEDRDT